MAVNYLYQKPSEDTAAEQADLEAELAKLQSEMMAGKVRISVNSGDVGSSSLIEISIKERISIVLARLYELDPDNYPAASVFRVTRTKLVGYGSY